MVNSNSGRKKKQSHVQATVNGHSNGSVKHMNYGNAESSEGESVVVQPRSLSYRDAASSPVRIPEEEISLPVPPALSPSVGSDEMGEASAYATPSCSAHSQTEAPSGSDGFLTYCALSSWERLETACEILTAMDAYELRLIGACIEGAARSTQSTLIRNQEAKANTPAYVANLQQNLKLTFVHTLDAAFSLISLLQSTNRQSAYSFISLIDKLMIDRLVEMPKLPLTVQKECINTLGKLVSSALHHPAFSVDQKIRMVHVRDELRNQLEALNPPEPAPEVPTHPSGGSLLFIRRFRASLVESGNCDQFLIEMVWNDGECTWVNRSRDEISSLHHRLLDVFGEERRERESDSPLPSLSSTPTPSTPTSPAPTVTSNTGVSSYATSAGPRILPYFSIDAPAATVIDYINGLSDLPARMMLSSVIYEEFFSSRNNTESSMQQSRCSPPSHHHHHHLQQQQSQGNRLMVTAAQTSTIPIKPFSYGPMANSGRMLAIPPSCSNCGGVHQFVYCPKKNMMQIAQSSKDGFRVQLSDPSLPPLSPEPIPPVMAQHPQYHLPPQARMPAGITTAPPPGLSPPFYYKPDANGPQQMVVMTTTGHQLVSMVYPMPPPPNGMLSHHALHHLVPPQQVQQVQPPPPRSQHQ